MTRSPAPGCRAAEDRGRDQPPRRHPPAEEKVGRPEEEQRRGEHPEHPLDQRRVVVDPARAGHGEQDRISTSPTARAAGVPWRDPSGGSRQQSRYTRSSAREKLMTDEHRITKPRTPMLASTWVGAANSWPRGVRARPGQPEPAHELVAERLPETTAVERILIGSTAMKAFDASASARSMRAARPAPSRTARRTWRPAGAGRPRPGRERARRGGGHPATVSPPPARAHPPKRVMRAAAPYPTVPRMEPWSPRRRASARSA